MSWSDFLVKARPPGGSDGSSTSPNATGHALALVPLIVAALFAGLMLPHDVAPEEVPLPTIDARALAETTNADLARVRKLRRAPLSAEVRNVGSALRAFNRAEAAGAESVTMGQARDDLNAALGIALSTDKVDELLDLRALQMSEFLAEVQRFQRDGGVSPTLTDLGGTFLQRMTKAGWCVGRRVLMSDEVERVAFKLTWSKLLFLDQHPRFALTLDETRVLYAFYFTHAHPSEAQRPLLDALVAGVHDAASARHAHDTVQAAVANWLLPKIVELARVDPTYPEPLARAVALYRRHDYAAAASLYESWLDAHPSGPWSLRVQNYLRASVLAEEESPAMNGFLRFVFWALVIFGAFCAIAYYGFVDVWTVPGDNPRFALSVQPTLMPGDVILIKRHGGSGLGDLLRCANPDEPRRFVVARMAATGGNGVHISGQTFSTPGSRPSSSASCPKQRVINPANGDEVELNCREEEFAGTSYQVITKPEAMTGKEWESDVTVPNGKAFLISDDRYFHLDSRDYGSVPDASCHHVLFRLWGADGFGDASRRFNIVW